jgi:transposase
MLGSYNKGELGKMKRVARLSIKALTELQDVVRNRKSKAINVRRAQAIMLINGNSDEITIRAITGFSENAASKLRKKYQEKGLQGIIAKDRESRLLLTKTQLAEVQKIVQSQLPNEYGINADFWSTSILAEFILQQYNVKYKSKTSYYLIFKKADFTYHKPDKQYHNREQDVIDKWYEETAPLIRQEVEKPEQVVLVGDEIILTTQTTTQKVWLPVGASVKIEASNKREKRCIYGFLNVKTGQEHSFKTDYTNSLTTCKMLSELIKIYPDQKIVIVWDNASWHRSKTVRDFLEKHPEKFHLFAFPPYYPDGNPQEHVWKAGRAKITHNVFIDKIDKTTDQFVEYLNQTRFEYKFL